MRRRREGGGEKWVETTITTFTEDRYATRNRLRHGGSRSTYGNAVAVVVVLIVAYLSLVLIFINLRTVE